MSTTTPASPDKIININIGILGHVDSGKTSLCKVLSTLASTASFDKNPQSQERGITLDLGFSALYVPLIATSNDENDEKYEKDEKADNYKVLRELLRRKRRNIQQQKMEKFSDEKSVVENESVDEIEMIQYTLVDCPGHASLIRTIIGGAQIIDFMVLVIDVMKGVQTQTAECIIIGELTARQLIVVLNKVDLIPEGVREQKIKVLKDKLLKNVFASTRFKSPPIIAVSALEKVGIDELIQQFNETLLLETKAAITNATASDDGNNSNNMTTTVSNNNQKGALVEEPFLFAIDHCFAIKGKGTVMTGTVLKGSVKLNQNIEIASLREQRKVKSIQMFKKPVNEAFAGDRIGLLVTQLDSSKIERGFASDVGVVRTVDSIIAKVNKIRYFKRELKNKSKLHVTVGHSTVMGVVHLFMGHTASFDVSSDFMYVDQLPDDTETLAREKSQHFYARIELESPIECYNNAELIASKLDTDIHLNVCRLALHGQVIHMFGKSDSKSTIDSLKVYKNKERTAQIDRIVDEYNLIGRNLLKKKNARLDLYIGKRILVTMQNDASGEVGDEGKSSSVVVSDGVIEGTFGASGKFKVRLNRPLVLKDKRKFKGLELKIQYSVNVYDKDRRWIQNDSLLQRGHQSSSVDNVQPK